MTDNFGRSTTTWTKQREEIKKMKMNYSRRIVIATECWATDCLDLTIITSQLFMYFAAGG